MFMSGCPGSRSFSGDSTGAVSGGRSMVTRLTSPHVDAANNAPPPRSTTAINAPAINIHFFRRSTLGQPRWEITFYVLRRGENSGGDQTRNVASTLDMIGSADIGAARADSEG